MCERESEIHTSHLETRAPANRSPHRRSWYEIGKVGSKSPPRVGIRPNKRNPKWIRNVHGRHPSKNFKRSWIASGPIRNSLHDRIIQTTLLADGSYTFGPIRLPYPFRRRHPPPRHHYHSAWPRLLTNKKKKTMKKTAVSR